MRITKVEALHCDGGWRPWTFVKVDTDEGLHGWGECSDNRNPYGIAGCVRDFEDLLVGEEPRAGGRWFAAASPPSRRTSSFRATRRPCTSPGSAAGPTRPTAWPAPRSCARSSA